MNKILIITGSVRPGRFNVQAANWIYSIGKTRPDIEVELVDLEAINLPFLDEPVPPIQHQYSQEHTIKWAQKISEGDGFIFVTPEYNHGVSPVLKNAVDFLNREWNYKPVSFVSYGSLAGGARAVEQWREIVAELRMYDLREQVMFPVYYQNLDENGKYKFTEEQVKQANLVYDELIYWIGVMKEARVNLPKK